MHNTDALQQEYEQLEAKAHDLQAKRDEALAKLREKHDQGLIDANVAAAEKQKEWMDAVAANALVGRDDAEAVASNLGLTLPED